MSLTRINHFQAAAGKEKELESFLDELQEYIAGSEGCLDCEVLIEQGQSDVFVVLERWESAYFHQLSLSGYPAEKMQAALALFGAPPEGAFYDRVSSAQETEASV